jgi:hypothetical protein
VVVASSPLTLHNLDQLNKAGTKGGQDVYLTAKVDITTNPPWLNGVAPDANGKTNGATTCCIIVVDHGSGNVDAFYHYFYAFNWGGVVLNKQLGRTFHYSQAITPDNELTSTQVITWVIGII